MIGRGVSSRDDFAKIADAHAGVEEQRLFFAHNQVGDGFFRLMRLVNGEDLRDDLIDFKPGIADRDTFESLVFGARQRRGTTRVCRIGLPARGGKSKGSRPRRVVRSTSPVYANSKSIFFAAGSSLVIRNLRICPARTASGLDSTDRRRRPSSAP